VIALHETAAGVTFAIKVKPRARRNAVVGELGGAVKIALTAPPVDGRANQACIEFLAELLSLPRYAIEIVSGQSSRSKVIRVAGISVQQLRVLLQRVQ
jgi:uncharacterized protein (TIGR00251 family)